MDSTCRTSKKTSEHEAGVGWKHKLRSAFARELPFICLLLALVVLFFYKAIFLGAPVSRMGLLYESDALFNPKLFTSMVPVEHDPSGYLLFFPTGHFMESCARAGFIPLWSSLTAFGLPAIGDIQWHLLSFHHLFGAYSSPRSYDFELICETFLAALGTYLLGARLGLSRWGSAFAAVCFAFSPQLIANIDLENCEYLFPWISLAFLWLSKSPSVVRVFAVGTVCALSIFAMHPEPCFFAVGFGALFCATDILWSSDRAKLPLTQRVILTVKTIVSTAAVAFCFASVALLPFFEFYSNCEFYKSGRNLGASGTILHYLSGLMGAGLARKFALFFAGIVSVLLFPFCFAGPSRREIVLGVNLTVVVLLTMPGAVLANLLAHKPFSYLAVSYGVSQALLLFCLCSGLGLDKSRKLRDMKSKLLFLAWALLVGLAVFMLQTSNISFLAEFKAAPDKKAQSALFIVTIVATLVILFAERLEKLRCGLVPALLLGLGFISVVTPGRHILPETKAFSMTPPESVSYLQDHPGRFTATGSNFFTPSLNLLYGVRDSRNFNPFYLKRYCELFRDRFNIVEQAQLLQSNVVDRLIDICSIQYILSLSAVVPEGGEASDTGFFPLMQDSSGSVVKGLRLKNLELKYDEVNCQVVGTSVWKAHSSASGRYELQLFLLDAKGQPVWTQRRSRIFSDLAHHLMFEEPILVPIPKTATDGAKFSVALRVFDGWTGQYLESIGKKLELNGPYIILSELTISRGREEMNDLALNRHYRLVKETADGQRIYENTQALPEAYIVGTSVMASNSSDAREKLMDPAFEFRKSVVLEAPSLGSARVGQSDRNVIGKATVARPDQNTVDIYCESDADGFLVLTDSFYPGWTATIDGKRVEIFPANCMFRAVELPKGSHKVRFSFFPESLKVGLCLACIALVGLAGYLASQRFRRSRESGNIENCVSEKSEGANRLTRNLSKFSRLSLLVVGLVFFSFQLGSCSNEGKGKRDDESAYKSASTPSSNSESPAPAQTSTTSDPATAAAAPAPTPAPSGAAASHAKGANGPITSMAGISVGVREDSLRDATALFFFDPNGHFGDKTQYNSKVPDADGLYYVLHCRGGRCFAIEAKTNSSLEREASLLTLRRFLSADGEPFIEHDDEDLAARDTDSPVEFFYFKGNRRGELIFDSSGERVVQVNAWKD